MHCGQCNICTGHCVYLVNIPAPVQYKIYALALPFDLRCESDTCNSYTMAARDLPDIYTLSPEACGSHALGVYFRQIPSCHGINDIFHFKSYSGALYWALYNKEAWLHEWRAATMLTCNVHNISRQYRHKLMKQRNLHVVIHNIAEQTLLLLFRLEMQTHNHSVRLSISVIFPGVLCVRLQLG